MFQSCDELLHALVHYTQHSRRVRDGFEFFFQFFCARNGHCIDGRPTTRLFACFRAGEGWRVRIPVPCIHEYARGHEYASDRTSNDVTSQLTVRVGSRIRTPPTKYKSRSNRWQHGALCEQDGLRKTLPVKLAVVSAHLLCVFLVRCNQIRDTTVVTGLKDASETIRRYAYIK